MTFDQFVKLALTVDEGALVYEDEDGFLCIWTNYVSVGDEDAPLAYQYPTGI